MSSWRLQRPPKPKRRVETVFSPASASTAAPAPAEDAAEQKPLPEVPEDDGIDFMADYSELQEDLVLLYHFIKHSKLSKTNNAAISKYTNLDAESLTWRLNSLKASMTGKGSEDRITKRVNAILNRGETIERDQISNTTPISRPVSAAFSFASDRSSIASTKDLYKFRFKETETQIDTLEMGKNKLEKELAEVKAKHQREHEVNRNLTNALKAQITELDGVVASQDAACKVLEEANSNLKEALAAKQVQRVASTEERDEETTAAADAHLHRGCELRSKVQQNEIEVLKDEIDKARITIEAMFQQQKEVAKDLFAADLTSKDLGFDSEEHPEYKALADELGDRSHTKMFDNEVPASSFDPRASFDPAAWDVSAMFGSGPDHSIIPSAKGGLGKRRRLDAIHERPVPYRASQGLITPSMIPSPLHLTKPVTFAKSNDAGTQTSPTTQSLRQSQIKMIGISPREVGTSDFGMQTVTNAEVLKSSALSTVSIAPVTHVEVLKSSALSTVSIRPETPRCPVPRKSSFLEYCKPRSAGGRWIWVYLMWFLALLFLTYREKQFWTSSNELKRQAAVAWRDEHWESELLARAQYRMGELLGIDRTALG